MLWADYGDGVVADARKQRKNGGGGRGGATQAVSNSCCPLMNFDLRAQQLTQVLCVK